jgi:hypothetical protein
MPMSEAAKEKMRRNKRDENGNVKPEIYERLKKAHEAQRKKKQERKEQKERAKELEKLRQEAEEARKKREIDDLKREIAASGGNGARADPKLRDDVPRQTGRGNEEAQGRAPAQAADPPAHGHHAGEKPPAPDGGRGQEVRGEESAPQPAPRSNEPSKPGGVRERGPDGDGLDSVGAVDKRTKDRIAAYAIPNASIPENEPRPPPKAKRPAPVGRVVI